MNRYPAGESWISDVEMGRCCSATVPMASESRPAPGDVILFEQGHRRAGEAPRFLSGGDCVQVLLTAVVDLGVSDSFAGESLFQISWNPLGRLETPAPGPSSRGRGKHARPL